MRTEFKCAMERRPLCANSQNSLKTCVVMLYSHLAMTLLVLNLSFDLIVFGLPSLLLRLFNQFAFRNLMTHLINYTTPIVFSMPVCVSGVKIYIDNLDYLRISKSDNSLILSNHSSRVDGMVALIMGVTTTSKLHTTPSVGHGLALWPRAFSNSCPS